MWSQLLYTRLVEPGYQKRDGEDLAIVRVSIEDSLASGTNAVAVDRLFDILA